jgi:hypothetical protein
VSKVWSKSRNKLQGVTSINESDIRLLHSALTRNGIEATIGESRRHDGQITTGHQDGTLLKIDVEDWLGLVGKNIEIAQHMANSPVAMPRAAFR